MTQLPAGVLDPPIIAKAETGTYGSNAAVVYEEEVTDVEEDHKRDKYDKNMATKLR